MRSFFTKYILPIICAAAVTAGLGSIFSTNRIPSLYGALSSEFTFQNRMSTTLYDLQHFAPLYFVFVLIAFAIAFLVGVQIYRKTNAFRLSWLVGAGAVAMLVMLYLMKAVFFGVPIVGGARDGLGLFLQALAGGMGGYVFHTLSLPKQAAQI